MLAAVCLKMTSAATSNIKTQSINLSLAEKN